MKPSTKIMVYDDSCPMCNWYTGAFIKTGLLAENGRQSFSNLSPEVAALIDTNICRNEIPLVDITSGKVVYGIDALAMVLSSKFGFVQKLMEVQLINKIMKCVYKLISYNRRVIVATTNTKKGFDCTPDFNIRYRIIWLVIGLLFNTLMLFVLQPLIFRDSFFANTSIVQLQIAHAALVCSNICIAIYLPKKEGLEYLGQINMLALISILLCIPLVIANKLFFVTDWVNNVYLAAVLFFVAKEYYRRMIFAGIIKKHIKIVAINIFCLAIFLGYISH